MFLIGLREAIQTELTRMIKELRGKTRGGEEEGEFLRREMVVMRGGGGDGVRRRRPWKRRFCRDFNRLLPKFFLKE